MKNILALDIGEKRIGVARASVDARLPQPLTTLANNSSLIQNLKDLIKEEKVSLLVIGRPRNLSGQTTAQTVSIEQLAAHLAQQLSMPIQWQDETLTSHEAKKELKQRGVQYNEGSVDALAACLILEDFLRHHRGDL